MHVTAAASIGAAQGRQRALPVRQNRPADEGFRPASGIYIFGAIPVPSLGLVMDGLPRLGACHIVAGPRLLIATHSPCAVDWRGRWLLLEGTVMAHSVSVAIVVVLFLMSPAHAELLPNGVLNDEQTSIVYYPETERWPLMYQRVEP